MPSPRALEALAEVAVKGADLVAEKLLGDSIGKGAVRAASRAGESAANKGYEALNLHIRESLLGAGNNKTLSGAAERQLGKALERKSGVSEIRTQTGMRFIDDEVSFVAGGKTNASRLEQRFASQGLDADSIRRAGTVQVSVKNARTAEKVHDLNAARGTESAPANAGSDSTALAVAKLPKEKPASPAVLKPREPVMPTRAFELNGERKLVSTAPDGAIVTEYLGAPLPFRFPHGKGELGSYGHYVSEVKQLKDGSVTLINPEGIDKIGKAFEKAHNTLGLQGSSLEFKAMPPWFQKRYEGLADSGVPSWYKGDSTWLYGQANAAKMARPVEANFNSNGLAQLRYENPVKMAYGPFEGLTGDAVGLAKTGEAVLVNTRNLVGERAETFVYRSGTADIQTWRSFASTNAADTAAEIRRVLLTPKAFLLR